MELEAMVQELWDREKIKELTHAYGLAIEAKDEAMMAGLFTEDGAADFGSMGWGVVKGHAALKEFYRGTWLLDVKPYFSNHVITIDGDEAQGTCALDNRATRDGKSYLGAGRLHDRYKKVDGEWKFANRRVEMFFFCPLDEGWAQGSGQRSR